jgi:hypothetical protein
MHLRLRQLDAIARNAFAESLRAPVFGLAMICAVLLAGVLPTLDYLSFLEQRRLVADSLLALTTCTGLFAAAMSATAVVGDELRRRTALMVLSKPVSRGLWLAGKLAGLGAALGLLWLALGTAVLWGSRVAYHDYWPDTLAVKVYFGVVAVALLGAAGANFFFGRSFSEAAVVALAVLLPLGLVAMGQVGYRGTSVGPGWVLVDWGLAPAVVLCWPAMLLAAAVAMTAACWLDATPTLLVTAAVFALGLVSDYLSSRFVGFGSTVVQVVLPSWQPFWVSDRLAAGEGVGWDYVAGSVGYAAAWSAGLLVAATAVFERRELG